MSSSVLMNEDAVKRAYARLAPFYNFSFGTVLQSGREHVVDIINRRSGKVLEVGVGTGISLSKYKKHLTVTGIDLSPEMLAKARACVARERLDHVDDVIEMDAADLKFDDDSFDTVVAMYVLTVVPDPDRVMAELARVCKPGGEVIIISHFSQKFGARGKIEKVFAPFAETLGWRSEFPISRVMSQDNLQLTENVQMPPLGLFNLLRFVKNEAPSDMPPLPNSAAQGDIGQGQAYGAGA